MGCETISKGWKNFAQRSILFSSLFEGTLIIEVRMRLATPTKPVPSPFIPENPSACKTIQGLFMNDDIVFEVGGDQRKDNVVATTTPVTFPAHRCIVENCSSIFADLCESSGGGGKGEWGVISNFD
jgi:hypothetical protein